MTGGVDITGPEAPPPQIGLEGESRAIIEAMVHALTMPTVPSDVPRDLYLLISAARHGYRAGKATPSAPFPTGKEVAEKVLAEQVTFLEEDDRPPMAGCCETYFYDGAVAAAEFLSRPTPAE